MRLSDVVSHSGLVIYAEVALVIFFLAFLAIVARLWLHRDRGELERMSRMPLDDEPRGSTGPGDQP
jgi:cbb3-type cytochrome oxidase subunit 3